MHMSVLPLAQPRKSALLSKKERESHEDKIDENEHVDADLTGAAFRRRP
jgi:hypothetical protein